MKEEDNGKIKVEAGAENKRDKKIRMTRRTRRIRTRRTKTCDKEGISPDQLRAVLQ